MDKLLFGIICGFIFGAIDVTIMIPIPEKDRRKKLEAMTGAFIERFMIGLLIPNTDLGVNYVLAGGLIGLLLSLPSAIITRVYAPIIVIGLLGGVAIGLLTSYAY